LTIRITPKTDTPLPYTDEDDIAPSLIEKMAVAGNTAELQAALGAPLELTAADGQATTKLFQMFLEEKDPRSLENRGVAFTAAQFLRTYAHNVAIDVNAVRTAITTKLMEIADCGDKKFELRALELLGKHSDINLFTERSEITVKHKTSDDLEKEITARVQRLLHADTYDVTPIIKTLDEDVWGAETLKALDALPTEVHPGWDGPARALPPEEEGSEDDQNFIEAEDEADEALDDFDRP
jgi:hypothetical protein